MPARFGKLCPMFMLATLVLGAGACSSRSTRHFDLTGCGPVQWGMSVEQVKTALGGKAKLDRNLPNGKTLETVELTIGGIELNGLVHADPQTGRVDGVYLLFHQGRPLTPQSVKQLLSVLHGQYGNPTREISGTAGKSYVWTFRSGNITLRDARPAALFYSQNPIGNNPVTPFEN